MNAERLTSGSTAVATRAITTATRISPGIGIGSSGLDLAGGQRAENFFLDSLVTIARPLPKIKVFKIPAVPSKKEDPLKMPHLEVLKSPTLDHKVTQNVFSKDYQALWQRPKPTPAPQPVVKSQPQAEQPTRESKDNTPNRVQEIIKAKAIPAKKDQQVHTPTAMEDATQAIKKTVQAIDRLEPKTVIINLQQAEQALPKAIQTQSEQPPQGQADLVQAVKTYQKVQEGLQAVQLQPQEAQVQAQAIVLQALKPDLKTTFQTLITENPHLTVEMVKERIQILKKTEEEKAAELVAEKDPQADEARVAEALTKAKKVLDERQDTDVPVSGAEIVAGMKKPDPLDQISEMLKNTERKVLDGSRQMFMTYIAGSTIHTLAEAGEVIRKARQLFPAVRIRGKITTEAVSQEDIKLVQQGETHYRQLQTVLKTWQVRHKDFQPTQKTDF